MNDPRLAADEAIGADRDEVVQAHAAGDVGVGLDVDVPGEHGAVGDVIRSPSMQSWPTWTVAIRKLWMPIRVRPSSFSVPRLIVTPRG